MKREASARERSGERAGGCSAAQAETGAQGLAAAAPPASSSSGGEAGGSPPACPAARSHAEPSL